MLIDEKWFYIGNKLYLRSWFKLAKFAFLRAIAKDPNNWQYWNNYGLVLTKLKIFIDAEEAFQRALQITPNNYDVLNCLGILYAKMNRIDDSKNAFRKAIIINPINSIGLYNLGLLYMKDFQFSEAHESFQKLVELDPENIVYQLALEDAQDKLILKEAWEKENTEPIKMKIYSDKDPIKRHISTDTQNKQIEKNPINNHAQPSNLHPSLLFDKFSKILRFSQKVDQSQVAKSLGISKDELFEYLISWQEKIPFIISGNFIINDATNSFIQKLDANFDSWEEYEKEKYMKKR
ncbi:MAG: tetratricopeptide repeat protein [Promethearchaeota archaeon]